MICANRLILILSGGLGPHWYIQDTVVSCWNSAFCQWCTRKKQTMIFVCLIMNIFSGLEPLLLYVKTFEYESSFISTQCPAIHLFTSNNLSFWKKLPSEGRSYAHCLNQWWLCLILLELEVHFLMFLSFSVLNWWHVTSRSVGVFQCPYQVWPSYHSAVCTHRQPVGTRKFTSK